MSSIRNAVASRLPKVPGYLEGKLGFAANYALTKEEAILFSVALNAICEQLEEESIKSSTLTKVTALFTKNGAFEFVDEQKGEEKSLGMHFSLAVYSMEDVQKKAVNDIVYLMVFVEELVHHYWKLEDEVETKIKVVEILNRVLDKPLTVTDLFPKEWLNSELERQGKPARY
ncbi:hypothetical protein ABER68_04155 [Paenibacillus alvei]